MKKMPNSINITYPTRSDTKDAAGRFLFQTKVGEKMETYLTTDLKNKTSIENWKDNFSIFFDIKSDTGVTVGIIGFSIAGISLFDDRFQNRRDYAIARADDEYRNLEKIESRIQQSGIVNHEDNQTIQLLWGRYNGQNIS